MAEPDISTRTYNTFPTMVDNVPDTATFQERVRRVIQGLMRGKTNNVRTVTLTANAATTDLLLEAGSFTNQSYIGFMPKTANAATEFGAGTLYVSSLNETETSVGTLAAYSIRITHANNANAYKTFQVLIVG